MTRTPTRIALAALALGLAAAPALAEPVQSTTEIAQLLEKLGDRCWVVDLDGDVLDADALKQIKGPIDIEMECVIDEVGAARGTVPATVI